MKYYLNIPLPAELSERVGRFERRWQGGAGSDPHITLVIPTDSLPHCDEAALVSRLTQALGQVEPFTVHMVGLGYFGEKRVVHIRVERSAEFAACQQAVRQAVADFLKEPSGEHSSIPTPHITLATRLSPAQGELAWAEASASDWKGEFTCTAIQLLRKAAGEQRWTVAAIIPFNPNDSCQEGS